MALHLNLIFCVCRTRRLLQALLLLLVSPPMVLFLLLLGYNTLTAGIDTDFAFVLSATLITFHQAVTSSIREAHLLGTWSYTMTCLGVLPNWLMFWCLAWYWVLGKDALDILSNCVVFFLEIAMVSWSVRYNNVAYSTCNCVWLTGQVARYFVRCTTQKNRVH